jgi:hypothetical protein
MLAPESLYRHFIQFDALFHQFRLKKISFADGLRDIGEEFFLKTDMSNADRNYKESFFKELGL